MPFAPRTFINKPGVTFDPLKTHIVYAEDLNDICNAILAISGGGMAGVGSPVPGGYTQSILYTDNAGDLGNSPFFLYDDTTGNFIIADPAAGPTGLSFDVGSGTWTLSVGDGSSFLDSLILTSSEAHLSYSDVGLSTENGVIFNQDFLTLGMLAGGNGSNLTLDDGGLAFGVAMGAATMALDGTNDYFGVTVSGGDFLLDTNNDVSHINLLAASFEIDSANQNFSLVFDDSVIYHDSSAGYLDISFVDLIFHLDDSGDYAFLQIGSNASGFYFSDTGDSFIDMEGGNFYLTAPNGDLWLENNGAQFGIDINGVPIINPAPPVYTDNTTAVAALGAGRVYSFDIGTAYLLAVTY